MEKTKLGLPVGITIAAMYLTVLFGGYIPALLLLCYAFLYENNKLLKISAVTALGLALACSLVNTLIGLIPNTLEMLTSFIRIFDAYYYMEMSGKITNFLYDALNLAKTVLFILLTVFATMDKPVQLGFIKKYFD